MAANKTWEDVFAGGEHILHGTTRVKHQFFFPATVTPKNTAKMTVKHISAQETAQALCTLVDNFNGVDGFILMAEKHSEVPYDTFLRLIEDDYLYADDRHYYKISAKGKNFLSGTYDAIDLMAGELRDVLLYMYNYIVVNSLPLNYGFTKDLLYNNILGYSYASGVALLHSSGYLISNQTFSEPVYTLSDGALDAIWLHLFF